MAVWEQWPQCHRFPFDINGIAFAKMHGLCDRPRVVNHGPSWVYGALVLTMRAKPKSAKEMELKLVLAFLYSPVTEEKSLTESWKVGNRKKFSYFTKRKPFWLSVQFRRLNICLVLQVASFMPPVEGNLLYKDNISLYRYGAMFLYTV